MDVMATARSIGLVTDDRTQVSGTIDEIVVLAALAEMSAARPDDDDLITDAAMRVRLGRSAGTVRPDPTSFLFRVSGGADVQLRYRSEMADVFSDLAIDIGMRAAATLANSPV